MNKENLLIVPTIKFVPFRKDNILRKFETSFRITDDELKISAASAFYPAMAGICQNIFEPHCFTERKSLDKVSNSKGFSDLAEGRIDMYVSLASKKNLEQVQKKVKRLQCVPIFQDTLAILVNKNNPVKGLNLSQLKNIYLGKIQNWQEVGGNDLAIHNYQLTAEKNVSRNAFNLGITEREPANLPQSDIEAMPDLVNVVGDDSNSIGNIFWSYYARMYASVQTRCITIDGVPPTSKDYPLRFDICMYYDADNPKTQLHRLVEYLASEEGKKLIEFAFQSERKVL
ncbi:MAG: substrate-binding domain-containing protein [Fibrobacter sp.]|nr:substrate-binding domain-containing protein [Fibrobacter sp.]